MKHKARSVMYRIAVLVFLCSSLTAIPPAAAETGPQETLRIATDRGLEILNDPELQGLSKTNERREKLWETLKPVFDFREIAKRALGPHWRDRDENEREEFTRLFKEVLKSVYLGKSDNFSGEKMEFVDKLVSGERSRVRTHFFSAKGEEFDVSFSLSKKTGAWKVYDVSIEGVSIVSNYRSQFNGILTNKSFDHLLNLLKEKVELL